MTKARGLADLGNAYSDGALSNRNILINGNLTVNQRNLSIASVATGAYGEDRWKKTAGGMTQIIEELNYLPSTEYTLSGTGITTQQITSPASGDWTLPDISVTARLIQLEVGDTATPFEHRSYGDELARCQRYCVVYENGTALAGNAGSTAAFQSRFQYPVVMRAKPSASIVSGTDYIISDDFYSDHVAATLVLGALKTSDLGCRLALSGFSGLTAGRTYAGVYNPAQDAKIMFDAEL